MKSTSPETRSDQSKPPRWASSHLFSVLEGQLKGMAPLKPPKPPKVFPNWGVLVWAVWVWEDGTYSGGGVADGGCGHQDSGRLHDVGVVGCCRSGDKMLGKVLRQSMPKKRIA